MKSDKQEEYDLLAKGLRAFADVISSKKKISKKQREARQQNIKKAQEARRGKSTLEQTFESPGSRL